MKIREWLFGKFTKKPYQWSPDEKPWSTSRFHRLVDEKHDELFVTAGGLRKFPNPDSELDADEAMTDAEIDGLAEAVRILLRPANGVGLGLRRAILKAAVEVADANKRSYSYDNDDCDIPDLCQALEKLVAIAMEHWLDANTGC